MTADDSACRFAEAGSYVIVIRAKGFADIQDTLTVPTDRQLEFTAGLPVLHEEVSVTAVVDRAEERSRLAQPVNIIDAEEIQMRAKSAVVQAAAEEVGLHVQRTSQVMSGIFVRGLTGKQGQRVRGRRALFDGGTARRRQHVSEPDRSSAPAVDRSPARHVERAVRQRRARRQPAVPVASTVDRRGGRPARRRPVLRRGQHGRRELRVQRARIVRGRARRRVCRRGVPQDRRASPRRGDRFARGRHAVPRHPLRSAHGGAPAGDGVRPVRHPVERELAAQRQQPRRGVVPARPAERRQTLRSAARRRRQPHRRCPRSHARSVLCALRTAARRMVRSRVVHRLGEFAVRRARQSRRQRQPAGGDQQRARAHDGHRPAGDRAKAGVSALVDCRRRRFLSRAHHRALDDRESRHRRGDPAPRPGA